MAPPKPFCIASVVSISRSASACTVLPVGAAAAAHGSGASKVAIAAGTKKARNATALSRNDFHTTIPIPGHLGDSGDEAVSRPDLMVDSGVYAGGWVF